MELPPYSKTTENIVFFDLETTVPRRAGQRFWVLEFGAIVVCPRKLVELESFSTVIRPGDLSVVSLKSSRCDGITREKVSKAPSFEEVADKIFEVLDGRIWAGHNIRRFDCVRIKEAFADIGRPSPKPVGMIDSLPVLTHKFGRRAGNMKMATLADYFGLGQQKHRSLDDVRMNLEVLKHCATVLFLKETLYVLVDERLYKRGFSTPLLDCINKGEAQKVFSATHEGECGPHLDPPLEKLPFYVLTTVKRYSLSRCTVQGIEE
uniref:Exonuclease domain-containing protein n=1 Tax=Cannabis sativa TaxID=3483 RepID=A0A803PBX5_CANSA